MVRSRLASRLVCLHNIFWGKLVSFWFFHSMIWGYFLNTFPLAEFSWKIMLIFCEDFWLLSMSMSDVLSYWYFVCQAVYSLLLRCPECNGYRHWKWAQWPKFKSCTKLFVFQKLQILSGKVSIQLQVNRRGVWALWHWYGNWSRRRKTLNLNVQNFA